MLPPEAAFWLGLEKDAPHILTNPDSFPWNTSDSQVRRNTDLKCDCNKSYLLMQIRDNLPSSPANMTSFVSVLLLLLTTITTVILYFDCR